MLALPEPPHFLVPCYTATIDRWIDPKNQRMETFAEASPLVLRHQAFLNVLFGLEESFVWQTSVCPEDLCNPVVLSTYRHTFPQLWDEHDLVVRLDRAEPLSLRDPSLSTRLAWSPSLKDETPSGCVLRLYVSGSNGTTENVLQDLHLLLEESLQQPYTLKVIDIHKHPEQAEADQIAATPTLIKVWPPPVRRIVGDLGDRNKVLQILRASPFLV